MVATELEVIFRTEKPGIRVRWRRSQAPPPYSYAVTVGVKQEKDIWGTVRLWDNADAVDEHHMHEYRREAKQKPIILDFKAVNEAMAAAIAEARRNAVEIVRQWEES